MATVDWILLLCWMGTGLLVVLAVRQEYRYWKFKKNMRKIIGGWKDEGENDGSTD